MRVVIFSHACVVSVNRELFLELQNIHEVLIVAPRTWKGSLIRDLHAEKSDRVCAFPVYNSGNGSLFFYKSFLSDIKKFQPDLIFLDEEPWSLVALQVYILFPNVKKVFYTKQNLKKKVPWPFRWIQNFVFRMSTAAFVISDEAEAVLRWKNYEGKATLLPHSFNPNKFCVLNPSDKINLRKSFSLPSQAFVAAYFGRLTEEKGIFDIIACAESLLSSNKMIYFLFVGNGPLLGDIQEFTKKFPGQCFCFPALPHEEVHKLMSIVDVTLLPSRTTKSWKEQFGRVIIESAACGVPVIGSDSGEIPNVIRRANCGISFREGDVQDLSRALLKFYEDRTYLRSTSEHGKRMAHAIYSHQFVAGVLAEDLGRLNNTSVT